MDTYHVYVLRTVMPFCQTVVRARLKGTTERNRIDAARGTPAFELLSLIESLINQFCADVMLENQT